MKFIEGFKSVFDSVVLGELVAICLVAGIGIALYVEIFDRFYHRYIPR